MQAPAHLVQLLLDGVQVGQQLSPRLLYLRRLRTQGCDISILHL